MTYRVNGRVVSREEFLASSKGIDFSQPIRCLVVSDYPGYDCPVTGQWVEGRAAHKENLKRTGCRLLERGERQEFSKKREKTLNESSEQAANFLTQKIAENYDKLSQ